MNHLIALPLSTQIFHFTLMETNDINSVMELNISTKVVTVEIKFFEVTHDDFPK